MGDRANGPAGEPRRSRQHWLSGAFLGFAAGVGICAAIGLLLAANGWRRQISDGVRAGTGNPLDLSSSPAAERPEDRSGTAARGTRTFRVRQRSIWKSGSYSRPLSS